MEDKSIRGFCSEVCIENFYTHLVKYFESIELEERKKLGLITHNIKEVISAVEQILANPKDFADTSNLMKKYYSCDNIIKNNTKVYDSIFSEIKG